jgi:protein SCO1/2
MRLRSSWLAWAAVAAAAAAGGAWLARSLNSPVVLDSGTWLPDARALEPFELTDQHGRPFDNASLRGHPSLMFFGFTHCPDVCPTTLAMLAAMLRAAPVPGLQLVFVTVDPERDTPPLIASYLRAFSPDFIGVTGAAPALQPLNHSLSVAAQRVTLADGSYTMDHSANIYLLDRQGRFVAVFTPPFKAARIAADLRKLRSRLGAPS